MQKDLSSEIIDFMKSLCEVARGFSNRVVGLGACSWHSIGQELLRNYKSGDQKTIDFVNNELLKPYAEKYKDKTPDFADFKNYPEEVLEFNEIPNTEFYKAYLMLFEGDHNQNYNRFPDFIRDILEDYSLDKRIDNDKKDNKKYMAYKKYIFDVIFSFGDNYLDINIDYDKLFKKIDELHKDKSLCNTIKIDVETKINNIIGSSIGSELVHTKIIYDFNNNWLLKDKDAYKINQDLLKNKWQSYRIGNILGQAFREYIYKLKKDHDDKSKKDKKDIDKIIAGLPEVEESEKPFVGQTINEIDNCLALIAQKTKKSSIVFGFEKGYKNIDKDKIDTDKYCLDIIDGKTKTVRKYQIKFIENNLHVYGKNALSVKLSDEKFGKRLLGQEVKELLSQIKKIQKANSFCFIRCPGHIEILNHNKENEFFNRINKVLNFVAANERSKTKDIFCRIGKVFVLLAAFIGCVIMISTVIPIIIFLTVTVIKFIQEKQNKKLSQTQARLTTIENAVKANINTSKLKEYIAKTKTLDSKDGEKAKPLLNWIQKLSRCRQDNFEI